MSTKIEWCDETWNPVTGCTAISEGCQNCYAKRMTGRNLWGYDFTPGREHVGRFYQPDRWRKARRIFVCSMGDLFHDDVDEETIDMVFSTAHQNQRHTFMLLTKRPQRMLQMFKDHVVPGSLPNVWAGVTVENQRRADERISILLKIPAAVRFVSIEPALGRVDLQNAALNWHVQLHWLIWGAETGPGKRIADLDGARHLRDQCEGTGIAFFFKKDSGGNTMLDGVEHKEFPPMSSDVEANGTEKRLS